MHHDSDSLKRWMTLYLAVLIGEPSETIDTSESISFFDLDSVDAVTMAIELEDKFGIVVHPETFLNPQSSIDYISDRLAHPGSSSQAEIVESLRRAV